MSSELSIRPHSQIHVRNLQTHLPISVDAWGRNSKSQPVLVSLSISLRSPFSSAASQDAVEGSTIHYGVLSKAVLSYCDRVVKHHTAVSKSGGDFTTVQDFERLLLVSLTNSQDLQTPPTFTWQLVDKATITVHLPKASLLGDGIKFTETTYGTVDGPTGFPDGPPRSAVLQLCNLKVPCIIGVNAHEREAKQVVIANVSLEGNLTTLSEGREHFVKLERVVTSVSINSFPVTNLRCCL
jgi:dihydroneopterin aldolase